MGSGRGKEKEYTAEAKKDREAIGTLSEAEKASVARLSSWVAEQGKDVTQMSGMKPYLGLYNRAVNDQANERQSSGLGTLARRGGNATQLATFDDYMKNKRQQDAAGALENSYNLTDASIRGDALPLAQLSLQRNLGKAGASANNLSSYLQTHKGFGITDALGLAFGGLSSLGQAGGSAGLAGLGPLMAGL